MTTRTLRTRSWASFGSLSDVSSQATWHSEKGIPVRNLWFLLVHASGLAQLLGPRPGSVDDEAELPDVLAILLVEAVERRLRRGLGRGYVGTQAALTRVRGRIDWMATESHKLLLRGRISCRYQELTFDRPRNRLARTALQALAGSLRAPTLVGRVRDMDRALAVWGVTSERPSRPAMLADFPSARETDDRLMVEIAQLALDVVLPAEAEGRAAFSSLARDEHLLRKIFEAGVAGYLRHHVDGRDGWSVRAQRSLAWPAKASSPGLQAILPGMFADIVLDQGNRRIVVDTKFTSMLAPRQHGGEALRSAHLYQIYAYLRSQEGSSPAADQAEGLLLYPTIGVDLNEMTEMQGHRLRFATINLSRSNRDIGASIIDVVCR